MVDARKKWIDTNNILIPNNCPICHGICEFGHEFKTPKLPKKSGEINKQKKQSKSELLDSAYFFLLRCFELGIISEEELKIRCREIGTSVDLNDLID